MDCCWKTIVWLRGCLLALCGALVFTQVLHAQSLEETLLRQPLGELAALAKEKGDAERGAIVFHQPHMACVKCHTHGNNTGPGLGPDLTALGDKVTDSDLVEAVLLPSKKIRAGFDSLIVVTTDGQAIVGLLVEKNDRHLKLRDLARNGEVITLTTDKIEEQKQNTVSIMPAGQVNLLSSQQQFLDLIRYLIEVRDGGARRAAELQPPATLLAFTVPEYENHLDHAGLISSWNADSLKRGEAIYRRVCMNCHGTQDQPGSLPTSLRFAAGKFKNGSDPLAMYRTLTHGFGLMAPQTWMVPSQKYDVIHYIRETYLQPHNPSQFVKVDQAYLAQLPKGDTRGPEPSNIVAWSAMDYGPTLAHTYEIPGEAHNFAYKGIAVRLDPGAGGVSRGRHWLIFDTDTLRAAAAWHGAGNSDNNFIDWQGIQFDGQHGIHPRIVGHTTFHNNTGPGWARPTDEQFRDDQRVLGRDGKRYGPLPRAWAQYRGLYHHGQQAIFSYTVGTTEILESPALLPAEAPTNTPLVLRTFNIGPRDRDLLLQVAEHPATDAQLQILATNDRSLALLSPAVDAAKAKEPLPFAFDGASYLEVPQAKDFDLTKRDFSIVARIKTAADGTLCALAEPGPKWTPDGHTFFIRGGRLAFDIGWVGVIHGKTKVANNQWHLVTLTWEHATQRARLYVDGKLDGEGKLAAKDKLAAPVLRIGFTAPNFPSPTFYQGEMSEVRFYQRRLTDELANFPTIKPDDKTLVARWSLNDRQHPPGQDTTAHQHHAEVRRGDLPANAQTGPVVAGFAPRTLAAQWQAEAGRLRLRIPAGKEPLRFTVWLPADRAALANASNSDLAKRFQTVSLVDSDRDLAALTKGGPPRWPQKLTTTVARGSDNGPFATDVLTAPESNPWLAQVRFSGLDFFPDGRLAVCSWDGDVWLVTEQKSATKPGETAQQNATLTWQRIASGLFQPLGLKIVDGKIHVTCRDQLVVLHDYNGDHETDFYQCLNNDHQVTEHFHEFAMGLQTDAAGNFYYAKSARHALPAVVPHHGTLLRVSKDGSKTEIIANGFRAANGVCLNPDGSFFVTDQEGHWNPKNRINWVTESKSGQPNFYGNMFGYHQVTDNSDAAMVPPLCWITNKFDRSPAELLWVDSKRWGALNGSLLNLSYGYGKVFLVPHERVQGQLQGGLIELPIPSFPTGVMRGRFHPDDGQLYLCGMFAWAGNATGPGGLYRLRATGKPAHLPLNIAASKSSLKLTFTEPLDPKSLDLANIAIKTWSLKRTANYGSNHYDEQTLTIRGAQLADDGKTLVIDVADLQPTWCMEIKYTLRAANGDPCEGTIHNTVHHLAE